MRRWSIALALLTGGCSLAMDFDRYSERRDSGEDISVVVSETSVDTAIVEDTTIADTLVVPDTTVPPDTTPSPDTTPPPMDTACGTGEVRCGTTCTVTKEDATNCGICGKVCDPGQYCRNGSCTCTPGLTSCSGQCVDTDGHYDHCGACGSKCPYPENTCRFAAPLSGYNCTLDSYGCGSPRTQCAMSHCFDLRWDETNCGACGKVCNRDEVCVSGCRKMYPRTSGSCPIGYMDCAPLPGNTYRICVEGSACPS